MAIETTDPKTSEEDFGHVARLLRGAMLDCDEATLRAVLSNNVNTIIAALRLAHATKRSIWIAAPYGD